MTSQAKWIAIINVVTLLFAIRQRNVLFAMTALTFLLLMVGVFAYFLYGRWQLHRRIAVRRAINDNDSATLYLWAERTYDVHVTLDAKFRLPKRSFPKGLRVRDILPDILAPLAILPQSTQSSHRNPADELSRRSSLNRSLHQWSRIKHWIGPTNKESVGEFQHENNVVSTTDQIQLGRKMELRYSIRPLAAGVAKLPGIRIEFTDPLRWFRWDAILPCEQKLTILPSYHKGAEVRSLLKNHNAIPQHGIHRQRRPGMGFELLELREYREGDPPKSIAWKASARRPSLMTRQYETEVPIRLNLIVEGKLPTRTGAFGLRTLDQINNVAASLAHIATRNGDRVSASLIDDHSTVFVPAGSGDKGFHQIAQALSEFSTGRYPRHVRWTETLQDAAFHVASEHYPELLHNSVNPTGYTWREGIGSVTRRRHIQLANLLAERNKYDLLQHAELLDDSHLLATELQRFLCDHGYAWSDPVLAPQEILRTLRAPDWKGVSFALQRGVLRAKDNEIFVLFVDLLAIERTLAPILEVCRMAKARHHRVAIISTSPYFERPQEEQLIQTGMSAEELRNRADRMRLREHADKAQRAFRELGIPCGFSATLQTIPWVLAEVELARSGRHSRAGANL